MAYHFYLADNKPRNLEFKVLRISYYLLKATKTEQLNKNILS